MRDDKKLRSWRPDSTNRVSGDPGVVHKEYRHWGWIESNYSELPPGPVGAAYIAAGTPLFLLGAGCQWLGCCD